MLKLVHFVPGSRGNWRAGRAVSHWYYWRREVLAYTTGLIDSLGGDLRGPRCYLCVEERGNVARLWLEDVSGTPASDWPVAHYRIAARHLGEMQGTFLTARPLPDSGWLSRSWLRHYLAQRKHYRALIDDPRSWETPLIASAFADVYGAPPIAESRALYAGQDGFLSYLDGMPATLCHFDVHPANLFSVGSRTVLIDWSFVGIGAVGEDAGNLVLDALLDFHVEPGLAGDLWTAVLSGYVEGLSAAGWTGAVETVERAMATCLAAKYAWLLPHMLGTVLDGREKLNGRPTEEALRTWVPLTRFLFRAAETARCQ